MNVTGSTNGFHHVGVTTIHRKGSGVLKRGVKDLTINGGDSQLFQLAKVVVIIGRYRNVASVYLDGKGRLLIDGIPKGYNNSVVAFDGLRGADFADGVFAMGCGHPHLQAGRAIF